MNTPLNADRPGGTALSVNLNKVALVRNSRHLGIPSVTRAATLCLRAGAGGITVHPRPDARHIRAQDVHDLAAMLQTWPGREYNIEGNPFQNLMDFVRDVRPHQATFVPDAEDQLTSDHGWNLERDGARLQPLIAESHALGVRVSLFMDPTAASMRLVKQLGADRIELYTESYARAFGTPEQANILRVYVDAAAAAREQGLGLNAGHDLSLANLQTFLRSIPVVDEVSIGHALFADALELGYEGAVRAYLACMPAAGG